MHSEKEHIFKVLGGRASLGFTARKDMDHLTRKRFPYKVVKQMKDSLELSTRMFAKTLSVNESTLARLQKSSGLLSFDASDRLLESREYMHSPVMYLKTIKMLNNG